MAVITQAEARVFLPGISADQATIATLITRADSILSAWCGYRGATASADPTFDSTTYTRYMHGPGGRVLQLPYWPVSSVTSIEDDTSEAFDGSTYLVASGDYDVERPGEPGRVRLKQTSTRGSWTQGAESAVKPIKAVFVAGYAAGSAPEAIKEAVAEMVAILWGAKDTVAQGTVGIGAGGTASEKAPEIPEHIKQKLRPFRMPGAYEVVV